MTASIAQLKTKAAAGAKRIKAPKYLQRPTRLWWESVISEFDLEEHHRRILTLACEAFDRSILAREILEKDGILQPDRFGKQVAHPAVGIKRDAEISFARLLRELALDVGEPASRPPEIKPR